MATTWKRPSLPKSANALESSAPTTKTASISPRARRGSASVKGSLVVVVATFNRGNTMPAVGGGRAGAVLGSLSGARRPRRRRADGRRPAAGLVAPRAMPEHANPMAEHGLLVTHHAEALMRRRCVGVRGWFLRVRRVRGGGMRNRRQRKRSRDHACLDGRRAHSSKGAAAQMALHRYDISVRTPRFVETLNSDRHLITNPRKMRPLQGKALMRTP